MDEPDRPDFLSTQSRKKLARTLREAADALESGAASEDVLDICGGTPIQAMLAVQGLML